MNKPGVKHYIIFCGILFLILASITAFILKNDRKFDDFYLNIYNIDKNINSGFYIQAGELLSSLYNDVYNKKTALIFLKRSDIIANATGNYSRFADFSTRIYDIYHSHIEIAAVSSYALRMNNSHKKALNISEEKLRKSIYKNIYLLNIIENNIKIDDLEIIEDFTEDYGYLFADNYTPEMFAAAAEKHWDQRWVLDEALLLLKSGDIVTANEKLLKTKDELFTELKMTVLYDNLDYKNAEKYFNIFQGNNPNLSDDGLFIGCDILMRNEEYSRASELYTDYINKYPDIYSLPYRNLYSINKNNITALTWLYKGLAHFPESDELLIPSAWIMYLNNDYEELSSMLDQLKATEDNTIADLFELNIRLAGRNPEHIIGNYWNVFNSDPESEAVAMSFANYLLQNRYYEQLDLLLQKYLRHSSPAQWVYLYSAIGKALSGNYDQAGKDIDLALAMSENYIITFNKALITELSGKPHDALEYYQKALLNADHKEINSYNLSRIHFKLAESNYNSSNFKDAHHNILMAIDLDPDNMKNKLMLRKIKEEHYD